MWSRSSVVKRYVINGPHHKMSRACPTPSSSTRSARPIGRAAKGSLKDVRADDLAAVPLRALVERNPEVDFARDQRHHDGLRLPDGRGRATTSAATPQLLAGIDHHVPATTVNRFCASSLQTIRMAFHAITAGEGDQYIAAGVEAVSRFPPYAAVRPASAARRLRGRAVQRLHPDGAHGRERRGALQRLRAAQDEWAAISQQRAVAARESGHFDAEIVPVDARRRHAR